MPGGEPCAEKAGSILAERICRESVQVLQDERKLIPLKTGEKRIGVIFPQFSFFDSNIMIEKEVLQEQEFVRKEFEKFGLDPDIQIVSIEPADEEIQRAVNLSKNSRPDHPLLL